MRLRRFESFPRHQPSLARLAASELRPGEPARRASFGGQAKRASFGRASHAEPVERTERSVVNEEWRAASPKRCSAMRSREGGSNSVVESQPSKLLVAGSIPVSRSKIFRGALPLELPYAVARSAWGPRAAPAGAPSARL